MLFDPVLNSAFESEEVQVNPESRSQPLVCSHCNQPIKGKYHQSEKNFYDEYCWQFKYVIDSLYIQRATRKKVKQFDEDGNLV